MASTFIIASIAGLIYPAYFVSTHKMTNNKIKSNGKFRLADYKQTIVIFWVLTCLILINLLLDSTLNLDFYPNFNTTSIILSILIMAFIIFQVKQSTVTSENVALIREKMNEMFHYLPHTKTELKWFTLLSISAGFCEEIIFRLFLFTFLIDYTHIIIAFTLPNVIFALTHIGSGKQNLISSFVLGVLFTIIYYFTDNIWLSITLHCAIDVNAGIIGYKVSRLTTGKTQISY